MNEYLWSVTFTGDYFTLITCVNAPDTERAREYAALLLKDHHGIDVNEIGTWSVESEKDGVWA